MTAARKMAAGGSVTDALRLAAEHRPVRGPVGQLVRLARFREEHPDITIACGDFGEWFAEVPLPDDDRYDSGHLHHRDLRVLLDRLDDHLGPPG